MTEKVKGYRFQKSQTTRQKVKALACCTIITYHYSQNVTSLPIPLPAHRCKSLLGNLQAAAGKVIFVQLLSTSSWHLQELLPDLKLENQPVLNKLKTITIYTISSKGWRHGPSWSIHGKKLTDSRCPVLSQHAYVLASPLLAALHHLRPTKVSPRRNGKGIFWYNSIFYFFWLLTTIWLPRLKLIEKRRRYWSRDWCVWSSLSRNDTSSLWTSFSYNSRGDTLWQLPAPCCLRFPSSSEESGSFQHTHDLAMLQVGSRSRTKIQITSSPRHECRCMHHPHSWAQPPSNPSNEKPAKLSRKNWSPWVVCDRVVQIDCLCALTSTKYEIIKILQGCLPTLGRSLKDLESHQPIPHHHRGL